MRLPIACYLASPSGRGGRRQGSLTERVKQQLSQPSSPAACSISSSPRGSLLSYNSLKGLIRKSLATLAPFPHRKAFALQNHKAQSYNTIGRAAKGRVGFRSRFHRKWHAKNETSLFTVGRGLAPAGRERFLQINGSEYPHICYSLLAFVCGGSKPPPYGNNGNKGYVMFFGEQAPYNRRLFPTVNRDVSSSF